MSNRTDKNKQKLTVGLVVLIVIVVVSISLYFVLHRSNTPNNTSNSTNTTKTPNSVGNNPAITNSPNPSNQVTERYSINAGDTYQIDNIPVLSANTLGAGITSSSLHSVGILSNLSVDSPITGYTQNVVPASGQIGNIQYSINNGTPLIAGGWIGNNDTYLYPVANVSLNIGTYILNGLVELTPVSHTTLTVNFFDVSLSDVPTTMCIHANAQPPSITIRKHYNNATISAGSCNQYLSEQILTTVNITTDNNVWYLMAMTDATSTGAVGSIVGRLVATRIA